MQTDILIVGGGLSGLALADALEREGRDWQLVEATERLGGRIYSPNIQSEKFDLGPAWFWRGQPRMARMIERFRLGSFEQYSQGAIQIQDRTGAVRSHNGYSPMQGSLRLKGGMGELVQAIADELPRERVHLNRSVRQLAQTQDAVVAETNKGLIRAKQVVLALPPRLIASNISFKPELPAAAMEVMASTATWMAGQAKFLAVYDQPYWRQAGFSGDAMSQRGPLVEIHDASPAQGGPYALFGFVGVPAHIRESHREELIEMVKAQLVELYGDALRQPLEARLQDWAQVTTVATQADRQSSGHHPFYGYPPSLKGLYDGRLIFGASEMGSQFGGYLEGALEAAENAQTMLRGPQSRSAAA